MNKVKLYVFLATGFEECEALATVDICRRVGIDTTLVSILPGKTVESAHGVKIKADMLMSDSDFSDADIIMLPGGMPGASNLLADERLCDLLRRHHSSGKMLAAICAAPFIFGKLGLLNNVRATCYPGFESELHGAVISKKLVETDGQFITAKGPGAAFELGFAIVQHFLGDAVCDTCRKGMICNE